MQLQSEFADKGVAEPLVRWRAKATAAEWRLAERKILLRYLLFPVLPDMAVDATSSHKSAFQRDPGGGDGG